jgi:sec-independent protein translocase protein TatB
MLSIPHMIVVFVIVLVVFGPQKLPELARGLGKLMAEFRKASTDFKSAFEEEMRDLERQARDVERKKAALLASSAAQAQPATLATPSGVETQPPPVELAAPEDAMRATEAVTLAALPVAESVARSTDPDAISGTPVSRLADEPPSPSEATKQKSEDAGSPSPLDPAHDQQQPA